ncbi:MAG: glycosyl transferase family 1 [Candidatus Fluviicola riflensis]|nr:MAG: glycosyl transferase family 1 [Candidatus Fluviicola riflensis]OGS76194.1 MAG: glycosyl transferase family 1 [Candidatus Fluviicola riflensis]OGS83262.1 MAG: glycosyl transferase family 1 [Fluviicola sp. RIFCSPHIGHO2_01_FULL_43_53]OGS83726.1 MAG: glycosyl transferase family 1 [Fluviicola sp. RIFCSPHIGHO2_12_FULL_43_24]
MKKVLILTYYWPPSGGAGVQRWLKFVKYLRQFGWEPIVYTVEDGEMPVIDDSLAKDIPEGTVILKQPIWEPYKIYKRFSGKKKGEKINAGFLNENKKQGFKDKLSIWIRGNFFIPDARKFWIKPSIQYLNDYLVSHPVDVIISSGPPHTMHMIALGVKKKNPSLKWIADFRDPWTNIDFYDQLMLSKWADKKHHRMEKNVLRFADSVISVGEEMNKEFKAMLQQIPGGNPEKCSVISNGYDVDDVSVEPVQKDEKFSIAHIGTLVKDRNPEVLWKVLSALISKNEAFRDRLEIKLVGKVDFYVNEQIERFGLTSFVRKIDYLPHDEVILEQQRSHVLLLLVNNTRNAKGILTGKFFEYMSSGCPIVAIGPPDGDLAAIIHATGSGLISGFDDEQQLEQNLLDYFHGTVAQRNESEIARYSRRELTQRLVETMHELVRND